MSEFVLRRAAKEDVPAIVRLCIETIPEVYGSIIPAETCAHGFIATQSGWRPVACSGDLGSPSR